MLQTSLTNQNMSRTKLFEAVRNGNAKNVTSAINVRKRQQKRREQNRRLHLQLFEDASSADDKETRDKNAYQWTLNDLTAAEWIKFSKSWFILRNGTIDQEKIESHPATFPASLAEEYIEFFTKPGEFVLDPFLGSGTTMEVAEQMGRLSVGIELQPFFAEFAKTRTSQPIVIGNAIEEIHCTEKFDDQSFDYVLTSPPYWNTLHKSRGGNKDTRHKMRESRGQSLIYSDKVEDLGNIGDVDEYLEQLMSLFKGIYRVLKPNRYVTIIIQNLNYEGRLVPIAWQLGILLAQTGMWNMKGERIWCKDGGTLGIYGYPTTYATNNFHHYCLTFQKVEK